MHLNFNNEYSLGKRTTDLEIETATLSNDSEFCRLERSDINARMDQLEKMIKSLRIENYELKASINQLNQNYQTLNNEVRQNNLDLKKVSENQKSAQAVLSSPSFSSRNYDASRSQKSSPLKSNLLKGESITKFQKSFLEKVENGKNDSFYLNPLSASSLIYRDRDASESFQMDLDFSMMTIQTINEGLREELAFDAVQPRNNLYGLPRRTDFEAKKMNDKMFNILESEEVNGLSKSQGRGKSQSPTKIKNQNMVASAIRNSFKKSTAVFEPKRLFENFFVLGISKDDVLARMKSSSSPTKRKDPIPYNSKVVYNFAENVDLEEKVTLANFEKFIAPWQLSMTASYNSSNIADSAFYQIVLEPQKKYKRRYVCPFLPHNEDIHLSKWAEYPEAINPQNKLYAICIKKGDYVIVDKLEKNKEHFVYIDTVYCFLTYYPISEFFFNLTCSILNYVKMKRKELYWAAGGDNKSSDFDKINAVFTGYVSSYLKEILKLKTPSSNSILSYPMHNEKNEEQTMMQYKCPKEEDAPIELAMWEAQRTFSKFNLENINLIVSAILLEKNIVFFSRDITNLTAALNTFMGLIFPFRYVSTIIPAVPLNSEFIFDTPVPIISGVSRSENYFWDKELADKTDFIFVFIDSHIIFINENDDELINFPKLDFIF